MSLFNRVGVKSVFVVLYLAYCGPYIAFSMYNNSLFIPGSSRVVSGPLTDDRLANAAQMSTRAYLTVTRPGGQTNNIRTQSTGATGQRIYFELFCYCYFS